MNLREITREEKISFYRDKGFSEDQHIHIEADNTKRVWTKEEWEDMVWNFWRHPELHEKDVSYISRRRELSPDEVEQLDTIWKIFAKLQEQGIDLGEEGTFILEKIKLIKSSIPKFS